METWDDVIEANKARVRELELRIVRSEYRELRLWNDYGNFMLGKGTAASTERWYFYTPKEDLYGDSIEEVMQQANERGYPVMAWCEQFNDK
jgi:hypothetical protein